MASNYKRYRQLLDKLGMTIAGASRFLDVDIRTSRRWANGDPEVPLAVMMLLELMVKHDFDAHALRKLGGKPVRKEVEFGDARYGDEA